MFITTKVKTLRQIVCDLLYYSSVIFKLITASDDLACLSKQSQASKGQKRPDSLGRISLTQVYLGKYLMGKLSSQPKSKQSLKIVCDLLFYSSVIFKSIIAPDDDFRSSQYRQSLSVCLNKIMPVSAKETHDSLRRNSLTQASFEKYLMEKCSS